MADDAKVAELSALTGVPPHEAKAYLEMAGGDLQRAANLVMDGDAPAPTAAPAEEEDAVRAPIPAFQDQIISAAPEAAKRRKVQMQAAIEEDSASMSRRMAFDRPSDSSGAYASNSTASGGQAINALFAAPSFNETVPYHEVIKRAAAEGKWVLVNIQQADLFASHALNRDVWSDDTITELVTGSCLFWQRDNQSAEGEQFCQVHRCGTSLPHICVVDPRTGRNVKAWQGEKWVKPHEAAEYLMAFLDRYPAGGPAPPPSAPRGAGAPAAPTEAAAPAPAAGPPAAAVPAPAGAAAAAAAPAAAPAGAAAEAPAAPAVPAAPAEPTEPVCELPEEPPEGTAGALRVSLRLPSGQRAARRFRPGDALEVLFATASALAQQPPGRLELSTQFPKRSLRELEGGLAAPLSGAQVAGSVVLVSLRAQAP